MIDERDLGRTVELAVNGITKPLFYSGVVVSNNKYEVEIKDRKIGNIFITKKYIITHRFISI